MTGPLFRRRSLTSPCSSSNSRRSCSRIMSRICRISSTFIVELAGLPPSRFTRWRQGSPAYLTSKNEQFPPRPCQQLAAGVRHEYIVLDTDAAEPGHVRAGLDGEDHTGFERDRLHVLSRLADPRILMDVQAETVSGAVPEVGTKTLRLEDPPGSRVHSRRLHTRPDGCQCRLMSRLNRVVEVASARRRLADRDRAADVT